MSDDSDDPRQNMKDMLGSSTGMSSPATPEDIVKLMDGTNVARHFAETAEDFVVASNALQDSLEKTNPAIHKLITKLAPLANRVELLLMSKRERNNHRAWLGGDEDTDDRDREAISAAKKRLRQERIREKYRGTTRLVAAYTGRHYLLIIANYLGDALRWAEYQLFPTGEIKYEEIDGDKIATLISEARWGEFSGIYAAAQLWAQVADEKREERRTRREQQRPGNVVPLPATQPGVGKRTTGDAPLIPDAPTPASGGPAAGANDDEMPMAARSSISPQALIDAMSIEDLTMMLLRRHKSDIGPGTYAILDIRVSDDKATAGRLV